MSATKNALKEVTEAAPESVAVPKVGDTVLYCDTYLPATYAAIIAAEHPMGFYDLVVFDTTQNPPMRVVREVSESERPVSGAFTRRD